MSQPQINVTPASPYGSNQSNGSGTLRRQVGGSPTPSSPLGGQVPSYPSAPNNFNQPNPAFTNYSNLHHQNHQNFNQNTDQNQFNQALSKLQNWSSSIEDFIELYTHPIKPYLPGLGRFLIVVTFYEDALRIVTQWDEQLYFLQKHRHFPRGISHTFLIINVVAMAICSTLVIAKKYPMPSVLGLLAVVIIQGIGYGLISDLYFFLRNLSVIGGLLMVLSDSLSKRNNPKANAIFAGLPNSIGTETERRTYLQLAGRILLVLLFLGFLVNGSFTPMRAFVAFIGLVASIMVAIGFKAKWSALFLLLCLSVLNILVNNWWSIHAAHPHRDFLKYDFFQTLSIVGGLLLLVNMGPGGISVDEKKKVF
ncbi:hypothetical protein O181_085134 [Austropuccinia psidii MF-1]|uniref:SURF4-domain-containing protein n=1 Tax=Austropuccinia psidii MF-1 TaxID=1389203 RepID=A0A9Q3FUP6_9BASI|nr:hypothetical protein [Austropuccinia psidii MF-1]